MKLFTLIAVLLLSVAVFAQSDKPAAPDQQGPDISGMYSFLTEGEFVQIDIDDTHHLTGFVSRYGDLPSDKGSFLDHLITKGDWNGKELSFTTKPVHGVWFEFKGTAGRGDGKTPDAEGYYVLKGTLTQFTGDEKKATSKSREVTFKSFPQDAMAAPAKSKD